MSRSVKRVGMGGAMAAVLVLTGCAGGGGGSDVEIEFFQSKPEAIEVVDEIIADFEAEHEGITVTQTNVPDPLVVLQSRLAKGDAPDVLGINLAVVTQLSETGVLGDISGTPAAEAVTNEAAQDYVDRLASTEDTVAVPWAVNATAVLYDIDQFSENGYEVPTTWDEFISLAEQIQADGGAPFYNTWKDAWTTKPPFNSIAGPIQGDDFWQELIDGDATFADSDAYRETAEKMLELKEFSQPDPFGKSYDEGNKAFAAGDNAMYIQGTWAIPEVKKANPDKRIGAFVMPQDAADEAALVSAPDSILAMMSDSDAPDEAQLFLDYLMSEEAQRAFGNSQHLFSVREDVEPEDDALSSLKTDWIDAGKTAVYPDTMFDGASTLQADVQTFLQQGDADAFLDQLQAVWESDGIK